MVLIVLLDLGTEIMIQVCAAIGIVFLLVQWFILLIVNVSLENVEVVFLGSKNGKYGRSWKRKETMQLPAVATGDGQCWCLTSSKCGKKQSANSKDPGGRGASTFSSNQYRPVAAQGPPGPWSPSEAAMATPVSDSTFHRLNNLEIQGDDGKSKGVMR
ncbi:Hypothetical predicted protein [Olea europaea subsp. europaea]|uniref:Uncharacterized protein n=1 Tax=Olea europaea subsp. europaea TaxID=158383 RepID=A0A8S0V2U8_OLEEU|nr:Hypothetical predicted protein [Olea europaea subsp. europaea]